MYEVELKVELTSDKKNSLLEVFKERGFSSKGVTPQHDVYIEARESEFGGFDVKRYRNEQDSFIYTEKVWQLIEGNRARKEIEHEVSREEFDAAIAQYPSAIVIKKNREWFVGRYEEREISITIDTVKFDHSPADRYFIEAEIVIDDEAEFAQTKNLIKNFLSQILEQSEIVESPGMFTMAFKKK